MNLVFGIWLYTIEQLILKKLITIKTAVSILEISMDFRNNLFDKSFHDIIFYNSIKNLLNIKKIDDSLIDDIISKIIIDNTKIVNDVKNGNDKAISRLLGEFLKIQKADPVIIKNKITQKIYELQNSGC